MLKVQKPVVIRQKLADELTYNEKNRNNHKHPY
jgi:hypothetical protein